MNLTWIRYDDLRSAVSSGTPFFIKEAIEGINVTWDDIINNVNLCNEVNDHVKYLKGTFITHKVLQKNLDRIARPIRNELREVYSGSLGYTSHIYSSMTSNAETFGRHKDTADVFFLGIKGVTVFEVWDKNDNVSHYTVNIGDVLFIPRGLFHNATAATPRSGISFGIERGLRL